MCASYLLMIASCIKTLNQKQTLKNVKKIYIDCASGVKNVYEILISRNVKLSHMGTANLNMNII